MSPQVHWDHTTDPVQNEIGKRVEDAERKNRCEKEFKIKKIQCSEFHTQQI